MVRAGDGRVEREIGTSRIGFEYPEVLFVMRLPAVRFINHGGWVIFQQRPVSPMEPGWPIAGCLVPCIGKYEIFHGDQFH